MVTDTHKGKRDNKAAVAKPMIGEKTARDSDLSSSLALQMEQMTGDIVNGME